jgi:membrane protease subunit (stomatin/prohibitin family)
MAERMEFTRNYSDQSTEQGFQFEFNCDRCGTGYRSAFQAYTLGSVTNALDAAGSLFGGLFNQAANLSERARSATWEKAHDDAFVKAAAEIKSEFVQCPRCTRWVCQKNCWNDQRGLCKACAPDMGVEMAAAQSSRTVEEIWAHSKMAEEDRQMLTTESWRAGVRATCPSCNAPLASNVKFCPECGSKIQADAFCSECGAKMQPGAKFCPECGAKAG